MRFDDLSRYLDTVSGGTIVETAQGGASCRTANSSCAEFDTKKRTNGIYWDTKRAIDDELIQELFGFDEARFIAAQGARNFAEAKLKYYDQVHFNSARAGYELPFQNLRGWNSLNHPPIKELTRPMGEYLAGHSAADVARLQRDDSHPFFSEDFQRSVDRVSQTELTAGNVLQLLPGADAFDHKLAMVKRAKRFMWVQVMVMFCDPHTIQIVDALVERKKAGVDVRVMLEGMWMRIAGPKCLKRLRDGGVDVTLVADVFRHASIGVMHPKIWIRDGEEMIIGGKNMLASEQIGNGFNDGYRDTDAWVKSGPAVTDGMAQYADTWDSEETRRNGSIDAYWPEIRARMDRERQAGVRGDNVYRNILSDRNQRMNGVCRVVSQTRKSRPIAPVLKALTENSRSQVLIGTPRMKFTDDMNGRHSATDHVFAEMVKAAEDRGVNINVITNGIDGTAGDTSKLPRRFRDWAREREQNGLEKLMQNVTDLISIADVKAYQRTIHQLQNLSKNIQVWQYFRYTHQKVQVFDHIMAGVGSFNYDAHSGAANHEAQMFCMDKTLVSQLEGALVRDIVNAVPAPR